MNTAKLNDATRLLNRSLSVDKQTGSLTIDTDAGTVVIVAEQYLNNRGNTARSGTLLTRNTYKLNGQRIAYAKLTAMLG